MTAPDAGGPRRGPLAAWVPIASLLAIVVGVGVWGALHRSDVAAVGDRIAIPYGYVVVISPRPAEPDRQLQPVTGTSALTPPPPGVRQIDVDVSVTATDGPVTFDPGSFTVSGAGVSPRPPVATSAPAQLVPSNTTVTRTLRYEVPAGTTALELAVEGADQQVPLTVPLPAPAVTAR